MNLSFFITKGLGYNKKEDLRGRKMPTLEEWKQIEKNCTNLFKKYVVPRINKQKAPIDVAFLSAELGYRPAVVRALTYNKSQYANMSSQERKEEFVNPVIIKCIKPFLKKRQFDIQSCLDCIDDVRKECRCNKGVSDFTYGNAQKWVNMSIKYYIILNAFICSTNDRKNPPHEIKNEKEKTGIFQLGANDFLLRELYKTNCFWGYELMPIDSKILKIGPNNNLGTWSKNDDKEDFICYWKQIKSSYLPNHQQFSSGFTPILYEMYVW